MRLEVTAKIGEGGAEGDALVDHEAGAARRFTDEDRLLQQLLDGVRRSPSGGLACGTVVTTMAPNSPAKRSASARVRGFQVFGPLPRNTGTM